MSNKGKKVKVHYTGTLDDGSKFDSSLDRGEPIEFVCMAGQMIPGFDAAVEDMTVGETKKVHIPAKDAYGEHDDSLVQSIPVGEQLYLLGPGGRPIPVVIRSAENGVVELDMNHKLAGEDLNFEITLEEVADQHSSHQSICSQFSTLAETLCLCQSFLLNVAPRLKVPLCALIARHIP